MDDQFNAKLAAMAQAGFVGTGPGNAVLSATGGSNLAMKLDNLEGQLGEFNRLCQMLEIIGNDLNGVEIPSDQVPSTSQPGPVAGNLNDRLSGCLNDMGGLLSRFEYQIVRVRQGLTGE